MSTQNINISRENVIGKCDLKCAYNFKYSESKTTAKNNGVNISLTYDNSNIPPVLYNNQKYTVSNISIYCPSIHYFNGSQASAEIVIEHTPVTGGPNMSVAIPITSSSESSTASILIGEIISAVSSNAPAEGESTNLNLSGFTLQNIVPEKPFYSYTDINNNEWIVFGILEAIPLSSNSLTTLGQIIKPFPIATDGNSLFFNSSGPNSSRNMGDGIYISCKPTGSSDDEIPVEYDKNTPSYDFSSILESPAFFLIIQIIIGIILTLIVFYFLNYAYSFITTGATKLPNIPKLYKSTG
jgi:carbonic anhydrase